MKKLHKGNRIFANYHRPFDMSSIPHIPVFKHVDFDLADRRVCINCSLTYIGRNLP